LSGTQEVCVAGTTTLSSTSLGGIWSSGNASIATVNSTSGVVTGVAPGTVTLTYTVVGTGGCLDATATRSVTVTAPPNAGTLSGPTELCVEEDTIYLSTMPGGTWSSSNSTVATIDGATGQVIGLSAGSTTITYTVLGSGGCANATASQILTVNALPNPTFTAAPTADVCVGTSVTYSTQPLQFNYQWDVEGSEGTDYNITAGGIGTTNNTVTLTWLTDGPKEVSVNYSNANGCDANNSISNTITINPLPVPTFIAAPTASVCVGTSVTYTTETGQTNYTWTVPGTAGTDYTITAGGIGSTNHTVTLTWLTSGTKVITVNYTNANGCTATAAVSNSLVVNPLPVPTFTTAPTAAVCVGASITYTTQDLQSNYIWTVPGTSATDYTITAGGIGSTNHTVTLTWLTSGTKVVTVNYTNANGCTATAAVSNSLVVNPLPVPTFTTAPTAAVCVGASITYTTQDLQSNYIWTIPGTSATDYTITAGGIGTTSNTVTLTWLTASTKVVTVNYTNANGCTATAPVSNSLVVNSLPVPTFTVAPTASVCIGASVTYTTQAGQTNYTWTVPGTAGTDYTITAGGIGNGSNTVTLTWLTASTKTVSVNYTNSNGCTATALVSNSLVVNPLPVPTFTVQPSNPVCIGDEETYTTQTGQSNYLWNISGTAGTDYNITSGGVGTGSNTVTIKWLTAGTKTVTVNYTDPNGCTGITPASNTIDLDPLPIPTFSLQPSNPVCIGDQETYTTQAGQTNYIWTVTGTTGTDYNITVGSIGTGSNTVTIQWLTSGTKTVSVNYIDANGCTGINSASNTIEISIYTSIDTQPANTSQLECFGDGFDPIFISASGSNLSYQWYKKPDNSDIGTNPGSEILGATSATLTPPSTPTGSSFYYVVVTGNCGVETSDLSGEFFVNPSGTLITNDPDVFDETVCYGGSFSPLEVAALGDGGSPVTYQWYQNTSPTNTGGVLISGATSATFTPPGDVSLADGLPRYYYASASSSCGTVPSAISGTFIVNPLTDIDSENLTGQTICQDNGPFGAISVSASGTGTLAYQWYSNTTGIINTSIDSQLGSNSSSYTPPSNSPDGISRYYYVVVSSTNGCGPSVTSTISGAFIVNPNNTATAASSTPTVCINTAIPTITHTTTSATGIGIPTGLPAGVIANWAANTITISGTPTASGTFNYSIPLTGGCGTVAATGTITVTPNMTVTSAQPNGTTCINQSLTAILHSTTLATGIGAATGLPAGVTANWAANTITISGTPTASGTFNYSIPLTGGCGTVAATGTITVTPNMTVTSAQPTGTTCINQSLTAILHSTTLATGIGAATGLPTGVTANWAANTITISGTPTASGTFNYSIPLTGGCGTVAATGTITVTPNMTVTSAQPNGTTCINQSLTAILHSTTLATGIGAATGLPAGVTANWAANTITISGTPTASGTFNYSIPLTGGCGTVAATGTITVNPRPQITNITASPICSGDTFTVTPANGTNGLVPAGTRYTWTVVNNLNITGDVNQNTPQTNISQNLVNTSNTNQTVTYTVTPTTLEGCAGSTFEVQVIVKPRPTINSISNQAPVCSGTPSSVVNFTGNGVAGVVYNWTNSNPSIGLAASGSGNIPSFITQNAGSNTIAGTITVTPTANGCTGPSTSFTITVNPSPIITLSADYCSFAGRVELIASSSVPGTTWVWNNGATTSNVIVALAGLYSVTATSPDGCTASASISVAEELVVDGSFTNFIPSSPNFLTEYIQNQNYYVNGNGATGLWPEGYYAVNVNANGTTTTNPPGYHTAFYGRDHTNNAVGPRNFLMVNGGALIGSPLRQPIIWEQTVTVEPNTDYYFSAWAMNLNPGSPAKLQFEINGELVGTILDLNTAPKPTSGAQVGLDNWREFRSDPSWSSGSATQAVIRIINLNTNQGGNDFALDDISFGTLSPFIRLTSAVGTDDSQVVCENSPIIDIEYAVGGGLAGPVVDNLPPGVNSVWNGVNLRFSGSPTVAGTYNYTVFTTGACLQVQASGTIIVRDTPTSGAIATNQTVCTGEDPALLTSTAAGTSSDVGASISYRWELNTNLTTPSWSTVGTNPTGATYDPPVLSATTQYRRITLATNGSIICESAPTPIVQITVQTTPTAGAIAAAQTICNGGDPAPFTSTIAGSGDGTITYRWESSVGAFSSWSDISGATTATYDAPAGLSVTTRFRRITISTLNGKACESVATAPVEVTVGAVPTAGLIATGQTICSGGDPTAFTSTADGTGSGSLFYIWESAVSPFTSWTPISAANLPTYDAPAGLTVTTRYRRITASTFNGVTCESAPTPAIEVTILPNNTAIPVNPNPTLCLNTVSPVIITHNTTGATGIVPQSASVNYNLPNGVTPSWNTGVLTISGTPTEIGVFNYNIPLSGGCGSVSATGTITVENPIYPIIAINVVNPTVGSSPPFTSIFTVYSNELTVGTYTINYSIDGINGGPDQTISVNVSTAGEFTFTSLPYNSEGTTILTINSIKKDTENCTYYPPNNNTAPFGVACSTEFWKADGNATFSVPAAVTEVTIQVFGNGLGGNTNSTTMNVIPGGGLFIVFDGTDVFVTEASPSVPIADRLAQAIVSTTGPNGRIVINYECTPPPPCSGSGDVFQYTDSEGYTVIRFIGDCQWTAPDGLDEFEVLVVGGGGGGGFGESAGGGGGGAVVYQQFTGITMNGLPGLQGAIFQMSPGGIGIGASSNTHQGGNGGDSFFTGPSFDYSSASTFTSISASGGGGGGSSSTITSIRQGETGASGGGGAANGTDESNGGAGSEGNNGGNGNGETYGSAGAGGGGISALGGNGTYSGSGAVMTGGSGGNGESRTISGENIYYGAGGGATASGAITNEAGVGGSPYNGTNGNQFYAGGNGNNNGMGQPATTFGSGGGAGRFGGAQGFRGVVYIRYPNFRILPIEYLYFNAKYNSVIRSGDLTWATAKEWENDRFEIERSVNNVNGWEKLSEVSGAGYSDSPVHYEFKDMNLPIAGGNIYYRLKQIDFDGDFTYSITKSINVESIPGTTRWRVFPNPTTGKHFNIEILDPSAYSDEDITLRIIGTTGQYDTIHVTKMKNMSNQISDLFEFKAAGVYTVEIAWGANREYHKVILRR
jgi:hypothetical protein